MKKIFIFMFCVMFIFASCAHQKERQALEEQMSELESSTGTEPDIAFTWDGELDPNQFDTWNFLSASYDPYRRAMWYVVQNPYAHSPIQKVALLVDWQIPCFHTGILNIMSSGANQCLRKYLMQDQQFYQEFNHG